MCVGCYKTWYKKFKKCGNIVKISFKSSISITEHRIDMKQKPFTSWDHLLQNMLYKIFVLDVTLIYTFEVILSVLVLKQKNFVLGCVGVTYVCCKIFCCCRTKNDQAMANLIKVHFHQCSILTFWDLLFFIFETINSEMSKVLMLIDKCLVYINTVFYVYWVFLNNVTIR
jgi:hypothetical protein